MRRIVRLSLLLALCAPAAFAAPELRIAVTYPATLAAGPLDGRVLVVLSTDREGEPRFQIADGLGAQQVFGIDVEGWRPGEARSSTPGSSASRSRAWTGPAGTYHVQALLHRYETFRRADGHTVKLPMDRGEGQQWNRAPGNLYSTPASSPSIPPRRGAAPRAGPGDPADPRAGRQQVRSPRTHPERAADQVLGPAHAPRRPRPPAPGFDEHPEARYPLAIFHGHFPATVTGFREEPPDPDLKCEYSERFRLDCYNRIQQEHAHQLYKDWTGPGFPRFIVVEIQHANPYYDDSYAVNSANLGPYGDAITYELIPYLEKKYRALGAGWARFIYGGSTGGWEALAAQVFYPEEYNGAWVACPDPSTSARTRW